MIDILTELFAAFAVLMVFAAYRQGLADGSRLREKKEVKPFFSYKPKADKEMSEAEKHRREEAEFVDNYEG